MSNVELVFERLVREKVVETMMKEIEEADGQKNCLEGLKLSWWIEREFDFELSEDEEECLGEMIEERYQMTWI